MDAATTSRAYARRKTPPYAALAEKLRLKVAQGALRGGELVGTEVSIAKESGLSRMTVRRAVQQLVDGGLLERRAGLGVFVKGAEPPSKKIAFLAGNLLWMPAVRVAQAVQEVAAERGFEVSVFDARGDLAAFRDELRRLPESGCAGAIAMSQHDTACNLAFGALATAGFPLVVVDQLFAEIPVASVASDNRAGGRLAAEALLAAGHKRIAFIGDMAADTTAARAQGVADACAAALVPPPAVYDIPGQRFENWEPAIRKAVKELLASKPRPTAVACSCDAVALHAMRALEAAGIVVPRGMSVAGFDDDPIAEWVSPPLTTIRQDFSEMGRRAFAMLAEMLKGHVGGAEVAPRAETVPVALVERGSIGECRNAVCRVENANRKITI